MMAHWLTIINFLITIIIPTCLLALGNIGNLLTVIIFTQKNLRKYSSSVYFIALAVADTFALNIECLHFFIPHIINYINSKSNGNYWSSMSSTNSIKLRSHYTLSLDTSSYNNNTINEAFDTSTKLNRLTVQSRTFTTLLCKLQSLTFYTAYEISSWFLVLLSFDRCFNISNPLNRICKPNIAKLLTFMFAFFILLLNSHCLFYVQLIEIDRSNHTNLNKPSFITYTHTYTCGVNANLYPYYAKFYYEQWNTFDFCISTAIPSVLLAAFNIKIMYKMRKSINKFRLNFDLFSTNLATTSTSIVIQSTDVVLSPLYQQYKMTNCYLKRIAKLKQMNFMLMSAVITFFIFYAPYSIYYMILYNSNFEIHRNKDKDNLIGQLLLLWSLMNVTFNFYFYYLTGNTIFRVEIRKIKRTVKNFFFE